jgi:protein-disulfide isomerase
MYNWTQVMVMGVQDWFYVFASFALPVVIWYTMKPFVAGYYQHRKMKYEFARLRQNPAVIEAILQQQKPLERLPNDMGIQLGNRKARNSIVTVSNPYCPPCAKTHLELDELLEHGDVKAQLLFTATPDPSDKKAPPVEHLLAIAEEGNEQLTRQALDDWYESEKKDYTDFAEKYRRNGEVKKQEPKVRTMAEWCKTENIKHTPTIYVNGRELPPQFNLSDLKYMFAEQ